MRSLLRAIMIFLTPFFAASLLASCLLLNGCQLTAQTLRLTGNSGVHIGSLNVAGNLVTVESLLYLDEHTAAGNIVSKHKNRSDVNYLLRPSSFELSAYLVGNSGPTHYIQLKNPINLSLNRWYHIAGTYDGSRIKFYVNGCLVADSAFTGNLCQNDYITGIGNRTNCDCEQFLGRVDEVRIWKTARSRKDIFSNMMTLAEPSAQTGLLAYYKFSGNYKNSQGNRLLNGVVTGSPAFYPADATVQGFDITGVQSYNADCDKINNGAIGLTSNLADALYSIDGIHFQKDSRFNFLQAGDYTVYATDREGCTLRNAITVGNNHQFASLTVSASLCRDKSFAGYAAAGTYTDTLPATAGCDTLRTIYLTESLRSVVSVSRTICEGESFEGHNVSGNYADTMVAANGCDSIRVLKLTVMNKPHPDLGLARPLCKGDSIRLLPGTYPSYLWQDGSTNEYYVVTRPGTYAVRVSNTCGSKDQQVQITDGVCGLFFPTAFTPNNDGRNDAFRPTAYNMVHFQWRIYNRFAQPVFETKESGKGWDGRFNGQLQPAGVYVWICSYTNNNKQEVKKGSFVLIR